MSKLVEIAERNHMKDKVGTPKPPKMLINPYHVIRVTEDGEEKCTLHLTDGTEYKVQYSLTEIKNKLNPSA
jgi:hypothetical protein